VSRSGLTLLLLKIGIRVSPRTVNKYLHRRPRGQPRGDLRGSTFLRLHAQGIIACDFFVAAAAKYLIPRATRGRYPTPISPGVW
jgi:hypothetical protein